MILAQNKLLSIFFTEEVYSVIRTNVWVEVAMAIVSLAILLFAMVIWITLLCITFDQTIIFLKWGLSTVRETLLNKTTPEEGDKLVIVRGQGYTLDHVK